MHRPKGWYLATGLAGVALMCIFVIAALVGTGILLRRSDASQAATLVDSLSQQTGTPVD